MQVQGVKLHVGCELKCTFNNIQVHCKLHVIVNETVCWLAPFRASGRLWEKRRILRDFPRQFHRIKQQILQEFPWQISLENDG